MTVAGDLDVPDAAFIAHARTDVEALLEVARAAQHTMAAAKLRGDALPVLAAALDRLEAQ